MTTIAIPFVEKQKPKSSASKDANDFLNRAMVSIANHRDKSALATMFDYFGGKLMAFSYRKTNDEQAAKEIVQDTMLAVWNKAHTFDLDKGNVTTWVYTIARNLCFDRGRKLMSRPQLISSEALYQNVAPEVEAESMSVEHTEQSLDNPKIVELLQQLSEPQKQVVILVYLKEMSHQVAADHLNVPVGTVKSRLRLAMEKLSVLADKESFGYE
jgi:RNA polymerase sigma-70 factor (ECF subfamily)